MNQARSFGRTALLALALVGAWIPAAVIASPASSPTSAAPEAFPASDETPRAPAAGETRVA